MRQSRLLQLYIKRSPFNLLTAKQLDVGLKQSPYVPTEKFLKHIDARTSTVISTKVTEDVNTYQKHASQQTTWGSRYRRPQTALAATVNAQLLTNIHKYDPVKIQSSFDFSMDVLSKCDLAPLDKGSMDFAQVESGGQAAPYWTASADGVGLPTADLHVLRALEPHGQMHLLE